MHKNPPLLIMMCHAAETAVQKTSDCALQGSADLSMHHAGLYNETAFRGLDFVLDQASQYGVKVMFTLTNNWKTFDSKYNVRLLLPPRCMAHMDSAVGYPTAAGPAEMPLMSTLMLCQHVLFRAD